jgi:cytidine deaminase
MDHHELARRARAAKKYSYSPYSRFRVGAAVLTKAGKVYTGCNVENSSYGLTVCAERTALFKAVSEGERHFAAIAIATDREGYIPPCGACRQVILDLAGDIDVILTTPRGKVKVMRSSELLPVPFGAKNLKKRKP